MRWMDSRSRHAHQRPSASDDFFAWVLSLPWVVERHHGFESRGARAFAIACEPLGIRRPWLASGVFSRVAVIVPESTARRYESEGLGQALAPMPPDHSLFGIHETVAGLDLEQVVLEAYGAAIGP